jgi:hypothetical protein
MYTLVFVNPDLSWTNLESVLNNKDIKTKKFQWPSVQEALLAAENFWKTIDRDGELRVVDANDLETFDPLTTVPLVGWFAPTHVTSGNHHHLDRWWRFVRRGRLWEAIQASLKDPGPSSRAQLFVYWGGNIPPEKFNEYQYQFQYLRNLPGFAEAVKTQYGPSVASLRRWYRLMTLSY